MIPRAIGRRRSAGVVLLRGAEIGERVAGSKRFSASLSAFSAVKNKFSFTRGIFMKENLFQDARWKATNLNSRRSLAPVLSFDLKAGIEFLPLSH